MDIPSVSCDDAGAETLTKGLPNEILLGIFRFLEFKDLMRAEQVCLQWKTVVEVCFATEKQLSLSFTTGKESFALNQMKRYGSSIETLKLMWNGAYPHAKMDWAELTADRYPRLLTIELWDIQISDNGFRCLSTKCCQLKNVTLCDCSFTAEGLKIFLQALPEITEVNVRAAQFRLDDLLPQQDVSAVLSNCSNLHTFELSGANFGRSDTASVSKFFKECDTLRTLRLQYTNMLKEMFAEIQNCSLLEELKLIGCRKVDDWALIQISHGCPKLRAVTLIRLPLVSDEGLKCFARCNNLDVLWFGIEKMTDLTLIELSNCVDLRKVTLGCPWVTDRGCAALLAHCPQLQMLDVEGCERISNATVDSAIEAVQLRHGGLVLKLFIRGTSVSQQKYENCHPLLHLIY